jgi:hypothetical protein
MSSSPISIYALIDPGTGEVRYVGKSVDPEIRFRAHLREKRNSIPSEKRAWIENLRDAGTQPTLKVLETVDADDWQSTEQKWIEFFRSIGANLTNILDGGEGKRAWGEKSRQYISEQSRKWWASMPVEERRVYLDTRRAIQRAAPYRARVSKRTKEQWAEVAEIERKRRAENMRQAITLEGREKQHSGTCKQGKSHGAASSCAGVALDKRPLSKRWKASIGFKRQEIFLGRFATEEEAARAYDAAAKALFGVQAKLNFPVHGPYYTGG